jgi:hypothetical protein
MPGAAGQAGRTAFQVARTVVRRSALRGRGGAVPGPTWATVACRPQPAGTLALGVSPRLWMGWPHSPFPTSKTWKSRGCITRSQDGGVGEGRRGGGGEEG